MWKMLPKTAEIKHQRGKKATKLSENVQNVAEGIRVKELKQHKK